jgi:hypothetical protein
MSLTEKQIKANIKKYIDTATSDDNGFMTPELQDLLGVDFMKAPASTMLKLHNAFEGGLVDHILRVMKFAYNINNALLPKQQVSMKSLIKVVYLHQIGKANLYIENPSQWHKDKLGKMFEFNEAISSMRVGERSVFYALSSGVSLNDDEYIAILNHEKTDDAMAEWHNSDIGEILKASVKLAIMEEKFLAKQ